jgi:hypothetical protein
MTCQPLPSAVACRFSSTTSHLDPGPLDQCLHGDSCIGAVGSELHTSASLLLSPTISKSVLLRLPCKMPSHFWIDTSPCKDTANLVERKDRTVRRFIGLRVDFDMTAQKRDDGRPKIGLSEVSGRRNVSAGPKHRPQTDFAIYMSYES